MFVDVGGFEQYKRLDRVRRGILHRKPVFVNFATVFWLPFFDIAHHFLIQVPIFPSQEAYNLLSLFYGSHIRNSMHNCARIMRAWGIESCWNGQLIRQISTFVKVLLMKEKLKVRVHLCVSSTRGSAEYLSRP